MTDKLETTTAENFVELKDVTVLIADGTVDKSNTAHTVTGIQLPSDGHVFVTKNYSTLTDDIIGDAKLKQEGKTVKADMRFYKSQVRDDIAGYPAIGGKILSYVEKDGQRLITRCVITEVSICSNNVDARIPPIVVKCDR